MTSNLVRTAVVASLALVLSVQGCDSGRRMRQSPPSSSALSLETLKNMTYDGFDGLDGPIVLKDGVWEGDPYEPASAARPRVVFAGDDFLSGDLDGELGEEAVVFLALSTGGSGQLTYVCVVGMDRGEPVQRATAVVGDRVQIRNARLIDRNILLDVVEAGPGDPACCPGQLSSYGWRLLHEGVLERRTLSETPGRLSLETIQGQEWVLRSWDINEPAPSSPVVTLTYSGGKFVGTGGCNRYFASVSGGVSAGDITVGPLGSTQMACPEEDMAIEGRFLGNLGRAAKFGFMFGRLTITCQRDGGLSTMIFERRSL